MTTLTFTEARQAHTAFISEARAYKRALEGKANEALVTEYMQEYAALIRRAVAGFTDITEDQIQAAIEKGRGNAITLTRPEVINFIVEGHFDFSNRDAEFINEWGDKLAQKTLMRVASL